MGGSSFIHLTDMWRSRTWALISTPNLALLNVIETLKNVITFKRMVTISNDFQLTLHLCRLR